jgi:F-box/leucine-rich repeat protein 2/20
VNDNDLDTFLVGNNRVIRSLDLGGCTQLTDLAITGPLVDITSVNLSWAGRIGRPAFEWLSYQPLLHLDLTGTEVDGSAASSVLSNLVSLRSLSLAHSSRVGDDAFEGLGAKAASGAQRNLTLTSLDLSGCSRLTDSGFAALTSFFMGLSVLSLSSCFQITSSAILTSVASLPKQLPRLRRFHLDGCVGLDDSALEAMMGSHLRVQVLTLKGIKGVTDGALQHLTGLRHSHILREVQLRGTSATWKGMVELSQRRPDLILPALGGV